MKKSMQIITGNSNPELATAIASHFGKSADGAEVTSFSDGEIRVHIKENVRGSDLFIIQSTNPPAENLLELLIMIDAGRRASAERITAVIPYFGYARQDRKDKPRVPITSKMIANMITRAGADRVLTMDLHADQIQGFFDLPLDHLYGSAIFQEYFAVKNIEDLVVMSPDIGGIKIARSYSKHLNAGLALIDKRRPDPNVSEIMNVIGDVKDKNILMIDDLIDTAGTVTNAAHHLKKLGARDIYVGATHGVLSGKAIERLSAAPIKELVISDTLIIPEEKKLKNMTILSSARIFAEAISRIHHEESISILFK